jgi:hypothetical protein
MSGGVLLYVDAKSVKRNETYEGFFSCLLLRLDDERWFLFRFALLL